MRILRAFLTRMTPTHNIDLWSENSVTAKRYRQKWTSDLQVESYDPVSVKWFWFVSLDDVQPQTNNNCCVSWLVEHSSANYLAKRQITGCTRSRLLPQFTQDARSLPSTSSSHGRCSLPSHVTRIRRPHHMIANLLLRFDSGQAR